MSWKLRTCVHIFIKSNYLDISKYIISRQYSKQLLSRPVYNNNSGSCSLLNKDYTFQKGNYAGYRRRPVNVIRHDDASKGKTLEGYASQQRAATIPEEYLDDDEIIEEIHEPVKVTKIHPNTPKINHIKEEKESLKFINFKIYDEVRHKYRKYFENSKSAKNRYEYDIFMVEGWRMCAEALKAGLEPRAIYYTRSRLLTQMGSIINKTDRQLAEYLNLFPLIKTPYKKMKIWSSLTTSPGLAAAFSISDATQLTTTLSTAKLPLTVVLDEIRDPNNLGSIIRTLVAVGAQKIVLMKGCCDVWDLKVLRSCCGGHFKMSISTQIEWDTLSTHLLSDTAVYLAESECKTDDSENQVSPPNDSELLHLASVANEASKSQTSYLIDEQSGEKIFVDESYNDESHLEKFSSINMPSHTYDEVKFYSSHGRNPQNLTLIIGGETGLSSQAKKFALENEGVQLSIPLCNDIESLNSSVAIGIISYEIAKQFKDSKLKST